jgi:uncharacterized protein
VKRATLALLFCSLVPRLALAADPATGARTAPLPLQVARALFPRESWQRFMKETSEDVARQIAELGKGQYELAPEFADRLRGEYEQMAPYDEAVDYQAGLLGAHYSRAELRQLLAFYRTPVGKRSIQFIPDLLRDAGEQLQAKVQEKLPDALGRLKPLVHQLSAAAPQEEAAPGAAPGTPATDEAAPDAVPRPKAP